MIAHRMLLFRLGLLELLSAEQIAAVREHLRHQHLSPGTLLFREGERCEHLHFVQDGLLSLQTTQNGDSRILERVTPGNVLGEMGVFLTLPYPCTAIAARESQIVSLHRDELRQLSETVPGLGWKLLCLLSQRLIGLHKRVHALSHASIPARIAAVILELAQEQRGEVAGSSALVLSIRQTEIAQMAGVTRETVSRVLADWKAKNWVQIRRGQLTVLAADALRQMANME